MAEQELDQIDLEILALLAENARRTLGDIAARVNLSGSAVRRRIDRLEDMEVIAGYTVTVDYAKAGRPVQAFTEVRFAGTGDLAAMRSVAAEMPEVQSVYAIAGDTDALVQLRAADVEQLRRVIERLRRSGRVTGTRTLVVLATWTHYHHKIDGGPLRTRVLAADASK